MSKILYFLTLLVLTSSLFIMLISDNYVRKIIGLSVMQSSVLIFYLMLGKVNGGIVPIERSLLQNSQFYVSPLPQVLMLTAIVVGFATLSLGLSLIYRISKQFNTISEHEINFSEATPND
ncbi:cation:proton antiporter subunit C [Candidatus Tisiphia endosymbiont of Sialis lutaria]|uniref:cation:proton antiporter subunit C n=1 Tax=Candidatus Tisiphia endosymbiont of Sialis lutaria TaxID=2029164 RepID=UPI00312CADBB